MAVVDKVTQVHCACKVGCMVHSTENRRHATYQLLHITLPFLCKWPPDGSHKTQITQPSNMATMIGTDVKFQCQYNIPDGEL
ncbi:hypothetical protein P7K49_017802 [Saguinus oedipus]|uniref:Uncharacterized protein n=1 Tax=Saguinus oedipus TaxID=9490 RepID=A0ABQ9V3J8_SAGOE|nr:hypothetical protein P7K49_017802 [Saguinus oedipus]